MHIIILIWQVIKKIEDDTGSFEKNKELLIKYLSLLLKYDWERSKKEISYFIWPIYIFGFLNLLLVMFGILLNYVNIWKEFIKNIVVFILVFILGYYLKNERKFKKIKKIIMILLYILIT